MCFNHHPFLQELREKQPPMLYFHQTGEVNGLAFSFRVDVFHGGMSNRHLCNVSVVDLHKHQVVQASTFSIE